MKQAGHTDEFGSFYCESLAIKEVESPSPDGLAQAEACAFWQPFNRSWLSFEYLRVFYVHGAQIAYQQSSRDGINGMTSVGLGCRMLSLNQVKKVTRQKP